MMRCCTSREPPGTPAVYACWPTDGLSWGGVWFPPGSCDTTGRGARRRGLTLRETARGGFCGVSSWSRSPNEAKIRFLCPMRLIFRT
ncbi:hypothetical protein EYF80_053066 [Liparis tanakae]|uniref:Uncharacterized protein n=1 Tax=Liparis tanakae TaxID=230148 RepID=A0A4Z2F6H5_9TELE|nr:hypothetical protein EYF80_053066 [Liparis tanakae]